MRPHGTAARYTRQKCRCDRCCAAYSVYQRARRIEKPKYFEFEPYWRPVDGCLSTLCWCGSEVLKVPAEEVRACRTRSCGQPDCQEGAVLVK